jgi:hypothetical protein
MTASDPTAPLAAALNAPTSAFGRRVASLAFRNGVHDGVGLMPTLATVATLGFLGGSYAAGRVLFAPWLLPPLLLLVPIARGFAMWRAARAMPPDRYDTALVLDENHANHDRLSTALEFDQSTDRFDTPRARALAHCAIADGVASVGKIDPTRLSIEVESHAFRRGSFLLGLLIAIVPLALSLGARSPTAGPSEPPSRGEDERSAAAPTSSSTTPWRTDTAAASPSAIQRDPPTNEPRERAPSDAMRPPEPSVNPATNPGAGNPASTPADAQPTAAARASARESKADGGASGAASGAGGSGAAASRSEATKAEPPNAARPKAKPKQPRESATTAKESEKSSGTAGGSSSSGGRLSAVGNERAGTDRGAEREDAEDTEEEEVEDDTEESEQRGGLVPTRRDRRQAASRELSISGNGPPGDGRGGPTPPKKSRGTASLILGIRLPDQVRGRPNPGTAKTSIEPVPPTAAGSAPREATAIQSERPSPDLQSRRPHHRDDGDALIRYYELLRGRPRPASTATPPDAERR